MKKISLKPFTWTKFTGLLGALLALILVISLFSAGKSYVPTAYKEAKENCKTWEATLEELEKEREELATPEQLAELDKKEAAVDKANEELDEVCDESSYRTSRYSDCYFNDFECKKLHTAVNEAENDLKKYLKDNNLSNVKSDLESLSGRIESATSSLESAKESLSSLKESYNQFVASIIGKVIRLAGFVLLSLYLLGEREGEKMGFLALGVMILSTLPVLFTFDGVFLANPYFWDLVILALFVLALAKEKTFSRKKLVAIRVIAIILSVLEMGLNFAVLILPGGPLYTLFLILFSFALVPINFKEYTKVSLHIFLSFVTFGIWLFVWIYHVTRNLNKVEEMEKRNPKNELLLCLFLPFYFAYYLYKNAEYIEFYGKEKEKDINKISILCFIIGFVCPLLSTILMQDKINQIVGRPAPAPETLPETPAAE